MPRISQEQTQVRHTFLVELIRNQPDLSRQEAQERFEEKFGAALNAKAFQQAREQVLEERMNPSEEPAREEPEAQEEESAAPQRGNGATDGNGLSAQPAKAKAKNGKQKNVFVDASKEQLVFLERIVQQLQEAGAANVRIDHSTDRWMVLVVDAK